MKKLLLLAVLTLTFLSCENDDSVEMSESFTIEGKWLLENAGGSEIPPNTMFEFQSGIRYTYYCLDGADCDWTSLTKEEDAIPGTNDYTFEDNLLIVDLNFGNMSTNNIEFYSNGNLVEVQFDDSTWRWWRIGTDPDNCN